MNIFETNDWHDVLKANCAGLPIHWGHAVADRLRRLPVDGRWCTTWCGLADQLGALGRLLGLDYTEAFSSRLPHQCWGDLKVGAALSALAEGRQVVWVDDEEVSAARRLFPKIAEAERDGRVLLIQPESRHGLTPAHLDEIEAFAMLAEEFEPHLKGGEKVTVSNVGPTDCRWPIGDPRDHKAFAFCGRHAAEGPYCPDHARLSNQKTAHTMRRVA